jgi:hypothetical protein
VTERRLSLKPMPCSSSELSDEMKKSVSLHSYRKELVDMAEIYLSCLWFPTPGTEESVLLILLSLLGFQGHLEWVSTASGNLYWLRPQPAPLFSWGLGCGKMTFLLMNFQQFSSDFPCSPKPCPVFPLSWVFHGSTFPIHSPYSNKASFPNQSNYVTFTI